MIQKCMHFLKDLVPTGGESSLESRDFAELTDDSRDPERQVFLKASHKYVKRLRREGRK